MYLRVTLALLAWLATPTAGLAQQVEAYAVPRTAHGHPDFQGVWATEFLTRLERPPGVDNLVATPEQALVVAAAIRGGRPELVDPQLQTDNVSQLAMVQGEYRTSMIVEPENGKMPYTQAGLDLAAWIHVRNTQMFDHPEQRPLAERCMENFGYPPMRAISVFLPRQIFQTRDHVVIVSEEAVGLRMIHLGGEPPPDASAQYRGLLHGSLGGRHARGANNPPTR